MGSLAQAGNNSLLSHVFTENMDKLQAVTFTHGCERDEKQASHIAAAGYACACVCCVS